MNREVQADQYVSTPAPAASATQVEWTMFSDEWPPDGVPVLFRNAHTSRREWKLASLTDFPLIKEDPSLPEIPSIL